MADAAEKRSSSGSGSDGPGEPPGHTVRMIAVVVALAAGFALVPRFMQSCQRSVATDEPAPEFSATVVANGAAGEKAFSLAAVRGKPVILDFWATWCGPCQAEMPIIDGLARRFKDQGLVVVGVNTSDAPGLAERFVARKGVTFPIVFDEGNDVAHKFQVDNLPTLVVISKEGKVVAVRHGLTSESDLERLIKRVL